MKTTVLRKGIADLFAFGGDNDGEELEPIAPVPSRDSKGKFSSKSSEEDDDEDDDDEYINDPKDRKLRKLSRESNRRRIANRELKEELSSKEQEIAELRAELKKADRLQKSYDKLVKDHGDQQATVRRMAIRRAIESDTPEEGQKRSWYDVNMVEQLLKKDELAVDLNDFSVGGIQEQLNAIAEEKPFLVKASETQDEKEIPQNRQNPSGSAPQSSATGTQGQQRSNEEAQMVADFPALSRVQ